MNSVKNQDKTIYHLPIIVSKKDLEIDKIYSDFYNKVYWKRYELKKK